MKKSIVHIEEEKPKLVVLMLKVAKEMEEENGNGEDKKEILNFLLQKNRSGTRPRKVLREIFKKRNLGSRFFTVQQRALRELTKQELLYLFEFIWKKIPAYPTHEELWKALAYAVEIWRYGNSKDAPKETRKDALRAAKIVTTEGGAELTEQEMFEKLHRGERIILAFTNPKERRDEMATKVGKTKKTKTSKKTQSGEFKRRGRDVGDDTATQLKECKTMKQMVTLAKKFGLKDCDKYLDLPNQGLARMSIGNRIRGAVRRAEREELKGKSKK